MCVMNMDAGVLIMSIEYISVRGMFCSVGAVVEWVSSNQNTWEDNRMNSSQPNLKRRMDEETKKSKLKL